uniref:Retrotransposon gag domain-containing protein n=1 Tax=Ananas comosus var. bracteatus TaxID=296719 RepID=A0A6V7NGR3_ANACO|nr:unnamed protein product [Ananas comosus var. bracteatus]
MLWEEFKRAMFANYFLDTVKRKLQEKFRKLKQGDRSVADYGQDSKKPAKYPRTQYKGVEHDGVSYAAETTKRRDVSSAKASASSAGNRGTSYAIAGRRSFACSIYCIVAAALAHYGGSPPAAVSAGRAMAPRQPEMTRSARAVGCLPLKCKLRNLPKLRNTTSWQVWF